MNKDDDQENNKNNTECPDTEPSTVRAVTEKRLTFKQYSKVSYDVDLIQNFLHKVFHTDFNPREEVLCWSVAVGNTPVFPIPEDRLLLRCANTSAPRQLYFCTATARPAEDGKVYNRQKLFEGLYVIVLDDIGTKCPLNELPPALQTPTYIVETSQGNYQFGYVLDEPIRHFACADALVRLIYDRGIADMGGKMPNKLVRLPAGVNGKTSNPAKTEFAVNLKNMDGDYWSVQRLLDACGVDVDWLKLSKELIAGEDKRLNEKIRASRGASPWVSTPAKLESINGMIDPVLEYLNEQKMIYQDGDEWTTIKCPWAHEHSDPTKDDAGYKPLGRGDDPNRRAFHCFHDSCAHRGTHDFLELLAADGGPETPVLDNSGEMTKQFIFDYINNCVWQVTDTVKPKKFPMNAFIGKYPGKVRVPTVDGKMATISQQYLWGTSPSRVVVCGSRFDPSTSERILVAHDDCENLYVNTFAPPPWNRVTPDDAHVKMFTDYLSYLIPHTDEREYFLDWLAAKCQNLGFRGAGIVMVAKNQGTGRTTLAGIIRSLVTSDNFVNLKFSDIIGDDKFNEYLTIPIVQADETRMPGNQSFYHAYEMLKDIVDTTPKYTRINPKYGQQYSGFIHSSFLFFSNHTNALAIPYEDRRFYMIRNTLFPAKHEIFKRLHSWLKDCDPHTGQPKWIPHIWSWLLDREPDMDALLSPPPQTELKKEMIESCRNPLEVVMSGIFEHWPENFIVWPCFEDAIARQDVFINLSDLKNWRGVAQKYFQSHTLSVPNARTCRVHGKVGRPKLIMTGFLEETLQETIEQFKALENPTQLLKNIDLVEFDTVIRERLELSFS